MNSPMLILVYALIIAGAVLLSVMVCRGEASLHKKAPVFSGYVLIIGDSPENMKNAVAPNPLWLAANRLEIVGGVSADEMLRIFDASEIAKTRPWRRVVKVEVYETGEVAK